MTLPEAEYRANVPRLSAQLSAEHVRGVHEDALPLGLHAALKLGCVVKVGGEGGEEGMGALQGLGQEGGGQDGGRWGEVRLKCMPSQSNDHTSPGSILSILSPPPHLQVHQPSQSKSLAADWTLEDFQVWGGSTSVVHFPAFFLLPLAYAPSLFPHSFCTPPPPPPPIPR